MITKFLLVFCLSKFATAAIKREVALDGQFPYVGLIQVGDKRANAILISNSSLVTTLLPEYFKPDVKATLSLGSRFVTAKDAERQVFQLTKENIQVHPENSEEYFSDNIAILHVPSIRLSNTVQPVPLAGWSDKGRDYRGDRMFVVSYGKERANAAWPKVLRYFHSSVSPKESCENIRKINSRLDLCITSALGNALCEGDIGAPILTVIDDGTPELVGIGTSNDCDLKKPSVGTRVASFLEWIRDNTSAQIDP